jgi:hypothetical protein
MVSSLRKSVLLVHPAKMKLHHRIEAPPVRLRECITIRQAVPVDPRYFWILHQQGVQLTVRFATH